MIPLWKGKNPKYFGVIRSKVKVTVTINIIFDLFPRYFFGAKKKNKNKNKTI
jgi:hypothetical protein